MSEEFPTTGSEANPNLVTAWMAEMGVDTPLPTATRQALLSIARFEAGWGNSAYRVTNPETGDVEKVPNEHNWGSIHCPGSGGKKSSENPLGQRLRPKGGELWSHCVKGVDKLTAKGAPFVVWFRGYEENIDGAQDLVRFLKSILPFKSSDPFEIAKAMKPVFNYGVTVEEYGTAIEQNAAANARKMGEKNLVVRGGSPAPPPAKTPPDETPPAKKKEESRDEWLFWGVIAVLVIGYALNRAKGGA